jgi:AraC family transcriptional regulator of adaptative response / DNA-3-methyladenine glycosylase II
MSPAGKPSPKELPAPPGELASLEALLGQVRAAPGRFATVAAMAGAAQLPPAALERLFQLHAHLGAAAFLAEARVRAAGRLLLGTAGPAWAAGAACGFKSQAEFQLRFRAATGLTPAEYQDLGRDFTLALPAHYRAEDVLAYHGRDPLSHSERVEGATLIKAMAVDGTTVVLAMTFAPGAAHCRVLAPGGPDPALLGRIHHRAARMLGLGTDPAPFEQSVAGLSLQQLVAPRQGLRIPLTADVWESLVWAILGQQVNLAFAYTLRRRLTELCGEPAGPGLRAHPVPAAVAALDPDELKPLQFSRGKADYLVGLARKVAAGTLPLEQLPDGSATAAGALLAAERGIGPWTTHYVLMRGCGFGDCVPLGDAGLTLALQRHFGLDHRPSVKETAAFMAPFAPHRSLATFHLWASLKGVPA